MERTFVYLKFRMPKKEISFLNIPKKPLSNELFFSMAIASISNGNVSHSIKGPFPVLFKWVTNESQLLCDSDLFDHLSIFSFSSSLHL